MASQRGRGFISPLRERKGGLASFIKQFFKDMRTPLYKNAIYLMANTVANNVFGFFFWMVVAWFYPVSDFGLAAALISAVALIAAFSRVGLEVGLIRYLPEAGEKESSMINSAFTITGGLAVVIAIIFLAGVGFWSPALDFLLDNLFFVVSFVLFTVFLAFMPLMDNVFVAKRRAEYVLCKNVVYGFVRVGLPAAFAIAFGVFGIFASWGVGAFAALFVGLAFFMRNLVPAYRPVPTVNKTVVNDMFHFSFGNYIGRIFEILPNL
ncbi:MAG: lipopolysaccharide biosynthesis protein, partial [Thermoplasmata archaeon]